MMRCAALACVASLVAACAGPGTQTPENPGVAFPVTLGDGKGDPKPAASTGAAPSSAPPAQPVAPPRDPAAEKRVKYGSLPDPTPLSLRSQWELELEYDHGKLGLTSATPREFGTPQTTPRRMGRFAVELWIGHELIDRVRFDFPLVTAPSTPAKESSAKETSANAAGKPLHAPVELHQGVRSLQTVLVPNSPRATRALLIDRASGSETALPWPPDRPLGPNAEPVVEEPAKASR